MIQINGHLLRGAPAQKVDGHRHWNIDYISLLPFLSFLVFGPNSFSLLAIYFPLLSEKIKDIFGCAQLNP